MEIRFHFLLSFSASAISNYTYEYNLNESKRSIDLLRNEYLGIFVDEFEMLTGYSFSKLGDGQKILTKLGIIIPLITESIIHITACEVLLGLFDEYLNAGMSSSTDAEENFHLNLGEYYLKSMVCQSKSLERHYIKLQQNYQLNVNLLNEFKL